MIATVAEAGSEPVLLDRVVAVVGSSPITLRDVRIEALTDTLLSGHIPAVDPDVEAKDRHRDVLIRRTLIDRFTQDMNISVDLNDQRIEAMRASWRSAFPDAKARQGFLARIGIAEEEIDSACSGRLRAEDFVTNHLPTPRDLSDNEIRDYYERERESRFLGRSLESVRAIVEADLRMERTRGEFESWLNAEMSRTEVLVLPPPAPAVSSTPSPPSNAAN